MIGYNYTDFRGYSGVVEKKMDTAIMGSRY